MIHNTSCNVTSHRKVAVCTTQAYERLPEVEALDFLFGGKACSGLLSANVIVTKSYKFYLLSIALYITEMVSVSYRDYSECIRGLYICFISYRKYLKCFW